MSQICVTFKNKIEIDSEDPELVEFLKRCHYSLAEFLEDDQLILDFLDSIGAEIIEEVRG